jgi:putative membrane protein
MTSFMAFLHHVAAFALVAALAVELSLLRGEITPAQARRLALTDAVVGMSAGTVLAIGLLRVFYFEKGAAYYFHNGAFLAKGALFLLVAAASIYPTLKFLSWRKGGAIDVEEVRLVRKLVHLELLGVVFILLFAALMADGIGVLG